MGLRPPSVTFTFPKALPYLRPCSLLSASSPPSALLTLPSPLAVRCLSVSPSPPFTTCPLPDSCSPTLPGLTNGRTRIQVLGGAWLSRKV